MAKAKKLPSGSWRVQVFDCFEPILDKNGNPVLDDKGKPKKKRIYKSFTTDDPSAKGKREIEREAAAWAASKDIVKSEEQKKEKITLGQAMDNYIALRSSVLSPSTIREYKRSRKKDLQNLMNMDIYTITQEDIQAEINQEALTHAPKSVRNMHGLLTSVLAVYRPDFAVKTKLPAKVRPKLYVPSDDDVKRLMEVVKDTDMELPVLLAAFGPMRRSEICALASDHVTGNTVYVEFAMVLNDSHEWVYKRTKSYAGDRYITFPDFVIQKLNKKSGKNMVGLLPYQISDRFSGILEDAGIPHFRFHDLRHYCASIQHAIGIPDAYIMQRGGWGNDGVLKQIYRHVMESQEEAMNRKANDYFSELCNTKCNTNTEKH